MKHKARKVVGLNMRKVAFLLAIVLAITLFPLLLGYIETTFTQMFREQANTDSIVTQWYLGMLIVIIVGCVCAIGWTLWRASTWFYKEIYGWITT